MGRYVILSTTDHWDYLFYIPMVAWAWNRLSWNVVCFFRGNRSRQIEPFLDRDRCSVHLLSEESRYRPATIAQVSRLFAGCLPFSGADVLMTSDADMMPLSDYWRPRADEITCYGHDLTGHREYPICYIAMNADRWREIIQVAPGQNVMSAIHETLDKRADASSADFDSYWFTDQRLITERLAGVPVRSIERGRDGGLARGRIDRARWWRTSRLQRAIDAHLPKEPLLAKNRERFAALIKSRFSSLPDWYEDFVKTCTPWR
jgi:hypothetical protein